jgi:hypothetical protein
MLRGWAFAYGGEEHEKIVEPLLDDRVPITPSVRHPLHVRSLVRLEINVISARIVIGP